MFIKKKSMYNINFFIVSFEEQGIYITHIIKSFKNFNTPLAGNVSIICLCYASGKVDDCIHMWHMCASTGIGSDNDISHDLI